MATGISWCDETINPIVGCSKTSEGCKNCYAEDMARRLAAMGTEGYAGVVTGGKWNGNTAFVPSALKKAYGWMKPRTIFVGSMGDIFHESAPSEWIDQIMRLVWVKKQHTFIFLTKRADRMQEYFDGLRQPGNQTATAKRLLANPNYAQDNHGWHMVYLKGGSLPNLVLGVSAESQAMLDERIPLLFKTPANRVFVSLEPMVGPVSLRWMCAFPESAPHTAQLSTGRTDHLDGLRRLNGVVLGGESGTKGRRLHPLWVISVRDQCAEAGVPFMFKQWSHENRNEVDLVTGFPYLQDNRTHSELAWKVNGAI